MQTGNDPFNYEHKYPEDDPYKEMAEDSRFWKTCVDEAAKVDANKVADWTDALDVLLVFAGLFSGVVSTFVCQTFQNLQVDPTELVYMVMNELLNVQRAIDEHGAGSSKTVRPRRLSTWPPDTSFYASRTAIWVNTLWFISLTLGLTTALIAVVTKQWIHQYMDFTQLGTPRARARVRHFRFIQLQAWHVPAIIGLLPVLMHVALGVFFAGLILLIQSLNTPAAAVVGLIVFFALLAYVGSNLFPVHDPSCPYRPLFLLTRSRRSVVSITIGHPLFLPFLYLGPHHFSSIGRYKRRPT
ncbi:hypothetical protein BDZ89DRAFT_951149 [Hymenopellis radicata]|nr:hypothetical protein BDZ89DRAFT_951149 [Hymenopellis radicata]